MAAKKRLAEEMGATRARGSPLDDAFARLDGFLTMKAQDAFGPSAQVFQFTTGQGQERWVLRREGQEDQRLGDSFKLAREAVQALVRGHFRRQREKE